MNARLFQRLVKVTRHIFEEGNVCIGFRNITQELLRDVGVDSPNSDTFKHWHLQVRRYRFRLIKVLREHHNMWTHTITYGFQAHLERNKVYYDYPWIYIPVGRRKAWGLRCIYENANDPIYIESRNYKQGYNGNRSLTNCDEEFQGLEHKMLDVETVKTLIFEPFFFKLAEIHGNGIINQALLETLQKRMIK